MKWSTLLAAAFCGLIFATVHAQKIATLEVEVNNAASGLEVPVRIDLNAITFLFDTALSLVEVQGGKKSPVPFQIEDGEQRTLCWLIKPDKSRNGRRQDPQRC